MGILATFVALGMMCGPVLGGMLVASFPWESIFLINLPIGVISFIVGLYTLPHVKPEAGERPMSLIEAARRCFANSAFTINLACMLIVFVGIGASEFILPFYFQDAHGFGSDISGLLFLALPMVNAFIGPLSGTVSDRVGCEGPTAVGLGVYVCGLFAVSTLDERSSIPVIVCCVAFMSCGTSIFQSPNNSLYMGSAPREALGFAGSLGSLARYAGMALGITAASHILYGQMSVAMGEAVTSFVAGRPDVFLFGFRSVFYVLMAVAAVGFALAMVRLVKTRARH